MSPLASLHPTRSSTLLMNSDSPPTVAKSLAHAWMIALRVSVGLSLVSWKSMTTFRPAMPPALFTTFAQASIASTDFLNRPGEMEFSTSARTASLISLAVMPISLLDELDPPELVVVWAPAASADMTTAIVATSATKAANRDLRMFPPPHPPSDRSVQMHVSR